MKKKGLYTSLPLASSLSPSLHPYPPVPSPASLYPCPPTSPDWGDAQIGVKSIFNGTVRVRVCRIDVVGLRGF